MILNVDTLEAGLLDQYDLTYVYEDPPGITRRKRGKGYSYYDIKGRLIKDDKKRDRLNAIAVPPTYKNIWYCPVANGHLQATGFDANNKKQYFYHAHWEALREATKFASLEAFGEALPSFRRKILNNLQDDHLHTEILEKDIVLSAMARILDRTGMRIGNEKASKTNHTYGLTTLNKSHIDHEGTKIHFEYDGKGGSALDSDLNDPKVSAVIDHCEEIPGQRLFEYQTKDKKHKIIDSGDFNQFLKANMGRKFSAKDFRTWRFSCIFLEVSLKNASDKPSLKFLLEGVAEISGNTPAILQSSYVHPGLISAAKDHNWTVMKNKKHMISGLRKHEAYFLGYLKSKHAKDALGAL